MCVCFVLVSIQWFPFPVLTNVLIWVWNWLNVLCSQSLALYFCKDDWHTAYTFRVHDALWLYFLKKLGSSKFDLKDISGGWTSGSGKFILLAFLPFLNVVTIILRNTSPCSAQRKIFDHMFINMMTLCCKKYRQYCYCMRQDSVDGVLK